ncbi:uncharacterized protein LOC134176390 [Corticium candelabrum]|uniref:uncharacterized protein LOC134176390 n=1 Tax=Corticium candelabrum TaxID=121492 RepID=UPI002E2565B4|nr:uncharacterized protein LOC134176390 [Corticium candelabrum]
MVVILAYLDDVFLCGPSDLCQRAFKDLQCSFTQLGLSVCPSKCQAYSRVIPASWPDDIPFTSSGITVLGSPIGDCDYVQNYCLSTALSGAELCNKLQSLNDPQSAMLILRQCHSTRLNHLGRTVQHTWLTEGARAHDDLTQRTFCSILGIMADPSLYWKQCCLSIKSGGFGLTMLEDISPAAFLAAWSNTFQQLPKRFLTFSSYSPSFLGKVLTNLPLGHQLTDSHKKLLSILESGCDYAHLSLEDLLTEPDKLQHRLTSAINQGREATLLALSIDDQCSARLRSVAGKEAGAWLHAIPSDDELAIETREYRLAAYLRLGLPIFGQWAVTCDCGATVDEGAYHLLTCKRHGGPIWQHDFIVSAWCRCLNSADVLHKKEVRNLYVDSLGRPDIVTFDSGSLTNAEIDVSLAHPYNKEVVSSSAKVTGHASLVREQHKKEKYKQFHHPGGQRPDVIPLVHEHFGRWGKEAINFLKSLGDRSKDEYGQYNKKDFMSVSRRRISVALQKGNAKVILRKLDRLNYAFSSLDLAFTDVQSYVH